MSQAEFLVAIRAARVRAEAAGYIGMPLPVESVLVRPPIETPAPRPLAWLEEQLAGDPVRRDLAVARAQLDRLRSGRAPQHQAAALMAEVRRLELQEQYREEIAALRAAVEEVIAEDNSS